MAAEVAIRFDKHFAIDEWIDLFRASSFNLWWERRHAEAALSYRFLILTAWLGKQMVGTTSVESDGVSSARIDDVVVHPAHRGRGIGSMLVCAALDRLTPLGLVHIQLQPIPGREAFFERLGFAVQSGATVMDFEHDPKNRL